MDAGHDECESVSDALTQVFAVLGKRWNGLILAILLGGPARFGQLRQAVPGIGERMLAARLAELAESGLVVREVLEGPPLGVQYRLTAKGAALRPALQELDRWAHDHFIDQPAQTPARS
ncbi:DNA-binding HxlR family transcriptional regulator [Actinoplanes campanulatus]|uniref:DNA-binding HxlR family transcriptional regulator n=1 Tax=Actinoplanes campanulatus TaxID=113559 RepID=A0A7W5AIK3_9ACTN|nr:helix-turn-helix domain-containing protein [Actinoplanes campanulatus]MBB3096916.1 DNA-binding HxlR family transcriptional regulator [Actinoplanes campanulatus]GGN44871.1 hypothetical protein GCM10010109_78480 [Actinoplanes campanulatus]GID37459.1 hypothetical protein Aca09nite_39650 [Actinoplanes campanulatus]